MILDEIVFKKKTRVEKRKNEIPIEELKKCAMNIVKFENEQSEEKYKNPFKEVLLKEGLSVIGEFKKASPSKGIISEDFKIMDMLSYYTCIGVQAFSILTEEDYFKGSDEYLKKVKKSSMTPILRKDFVIDFYQIYEAKILGADGILLIAAVLGKKLGEFFEEAKKFNLQPLVEVHNKEELDLALKYDCDVIGINNRDLKTFNVTLDTTRELKSYVPEDRILVSESGIMSVDDLKLIKSYGVNGVLIGEFLMRNIDNVEFKNEIKEIIN
ncbi:indole-3-glycerol phosphate synthase TrpC [uncultured Clostridium sp.]|uniref:indole-3-glycerol phosphate synthase TrpC n=1 Tax=uncultured Clostridium sp. TaxID=59620 RepID=UPI0025F1F47A|nr:indole-3-glycerol phosphate synthase TrpC [uncultured Clostridium sp.]